MPKLYVFGIGGTGSRVLRSLTMLLAAGVKCDATTIVPIIIDPDSAAADLTRTVELMRRYIRIRKNLTLGSSSTNHFYYTDIQESVTNFCIPLNNTQNGTFKAYMDCNSMEPNNQALLNMLFSDANLQANMNVGFKGNPNIGSIVLNQFANSQPFVAFANNFQQGDKIFIISSIFGGTGASGFPLLLKTLRSSTTIPNNALINNATIGAISVLPYFNLNVNEKSAIDSTTFVSKTRAALSYYDLNISGNNSLDTMYYVADSTTNSYPNCEGGMKQKNDAHLVEMISALAILDFAQNGVRLTDTNPNTVHKEFGLATPQASAQIHLTDFAPTTKGQITKPLLRFMLFRNYLTFAREKQYKFQPWAIENSFDQSFFQSDYYKDIQSFQDAYFEWLTEMGRNKRAFSPFDLSEKKTAFDIVHGIPSKKTIQWPFFCDNYALFDNYLNKYKKTQKNSAENNRFMEIFFLATDKLISSKYTL